MAAILPGGVAVPVKPLSGSIVLILTESGCHLTRPHRPRLLTVLVSHPKLCWPFPRTMTHLDPDA